MRSNAAKPKTKREKAVGSGSDYKRELLNVVGDNDMVVIYVRQTWTGKDGQHHQALGFDGGRWGLIFTFHIGREEPGSDLKDVKHCHVPSI
jgi:hypothetical protein